MWGAVVVCSVQILCKEVTRATILWRDLLEIVGCATNLKEGEFVTGTITESGMPTRKPFLSPHVIDQKMTHAQKKKRKSSNEARACDEI